jgi:hypothetical protein
LEAVAKKKAPTPENWGLNLGANPEGITPARVCRELTL